jgi:hypothetical protein
MKNENTFKNTEAIPSWLSNKIRHSAIIESLFLILSFACATILFLVIGFILLYEEVESIIAAIFWMTIFLGAILLLGRELYKSLRLYFRPERSQEIIYLHRFGTLNEIVNQVIIELRNPTNKTYGKEVTITTNWLVVSGGSRFAIRKLDDLVWVYLKVSTTKLNWVIPIWRTYYAVFLTSDKMSVEAKCSKKQVERLIDHLANRCPWIAKGYTQEAMNLWTSDSASFIAAVQERKTSRRGAL